MSPLEGAVARAKTEVSWPTSGAIEDAPPRSPPAGLAPAAAAGAVARRERLDERDLGQLAGGGVDAPRAQLAARVGRHGHGARAAAAVVGER